MPGGLILTRSALGFSQSKQHGTHRPTPQRKPPKLDCAEFKRARLGTPFASALKCQILFDFPRSAARSRLHPLWARRNREHSEPVCSNNCVIVWSVSF